MRTAGDNRKDESYLNEIPLPCLSSDINTQRDTKRKREIKQF
jgi:hypothetical protein